MCKLAFNIVEIPDGESQRKEKLGQKDLDLSPFEFSGGVIEIDFNRQLRFIEVNFKIRAVVLLTCDRSLKVFEHKIEAIYAVVFKTDVRKETENENGAVRKFDIANNTFSIENEVRDSVLLKIPLKKIHPDFRDDDGNIKEFEPKTFGEPPEEEEKTIDPRWEKLKKL